MSSQSKAKVERDRTQLLERASLLVGTLWAEARVAELQHENRPVAGGWPGTISEARGRTQAHLDPLLARRAMRRLTHDELSTVARDTYESARRLWLSQRVRIADE